MTITPEQVAALKADATPGPWLLDTNVSFSLFDAKGNVICDVVVRDGLRKTKATSRFIAAAHDMADLIARMDEALKAADALAEKAHRIANFTIGGMLADDAETRAKYPALATAIIEARDALAAFTAAREKLHD